MAEGIKAPNLEIQRAARATAIGAWMLVLGALQMARF
jgi:hypothetical protein